MINNKNNTTTTPGIPDSHNELKGNDGDKSAASGGVLILCVETLEAAVEETQQVRHPKRGSRLGPTLNAPVTAFQHTRRRVAHGGKTSLMKRIISQEAIRSVCGDDDEEDEVSPQRVDDRLERARARRARLQQRKEEAAASKLSEKLEQAALRRDQILQERQAAHETADKVRNFRLHQARQRKIIALVKYSFQVGPLLATFRQSGLHLQGARTTDQVEAILFDDPFAPCAHCLKSNPSAPICPASGRRHPKRLVSCSEEFLSATSELKQIVNSRQKKACSETTSATPIAGGEKVHSAAVSDDSSDANLSTATAEQQQGEQVTKKKRKDPIGLPHFLPLAFHEACGFRACQDEQKLFAARNVVLLLEEIQGAAACVVQDFAMLCAANEKDKDDEMSASRNSCEFPASPTGLVEDAFKELLDRQQKVVSSSACVDEDTVLLSPSCAAVSELHAKCEHLRHALSRFIKSWIQFSKLMRVEQVEAEEAKTASQKRRTAHQMIRSYVHLTVTEFYRNEDIQRRSDLVNSEDCPSALRNREKWVSERREELSSAIELQMKALKKAIEQLGYLDDLEDELSKVNYTSSTSAIPGTTPQKKRKEAVYSTPQQSDSATGTQAGLTTDGLSSTANTTPSLSAATSPQRKPASSTQQDGNKVTPSDVAPPAGPLPHVGSADWCDGLLDRDEGESDVSPAPTRSNNKYQDPTACVLFPSSSPPPPPAAPRKGSLRSSEAFRAQLAADRQRLRRQRQKESRALHAGGEDADGEN